MWQDRVPQTQDHNRSRKIENTSIEASTESLVSILSSWDHLSVMSEMLVTIKEKTEVLCFGV